MTLRCWKVWYSKNTKLNSVVTWSRLSGVKAPKDWLKDLIETITSSPRATLFPRTLHGTKTLLGFLTKKAQERIYFLLLLKKLNLAKMMMLHVDTTITQSILTLLHHYLVSCCHCQGQGQIATYHLHCKEGHWLQPSRVSQPPGL